MARIAGVNIPDQKHVVISLTSIFGVGRPRAAEICQATHITPATKVKDLSDAELETLRQAVATYEIEGDLRRKVSLDIKQLIELGTYRGRRHRVGLPVRGQRTSTNAQTAKKRRRRK